MIFENKKDTESEVPTHLAINVTITSPHKSETEEDRVSLVLERFHWTSIGNSPDSPIISLKTKTGVCTLVWIPAGRNVYKILLNGKGVGGYQIKFSSPTTLQIGDYSKILPKLALEVTEYEPVYKASDSGTWSLWFKYIVQVQEEGVWSWQLVLPDGLPSPSPSTSSQPPPAPTLYSSASSPALNTIINNEITNNSIKTNIVIAYPYVRLRVIDNDSLEEFPSVLGCTPPRRFSSNELGYTVMGEIKCPFRVPSSKCKLRVISSHPLFTAECETTRCVHEYEEVYVPSQTAPLFRDVLRVKEKAQVAIHVGVPPANGNVYIKLQIFDKGEEIYSTEGKRCCIIPVFYLYPTQKKEEEYHKYILQATIIRYIPSIYDTPRTRVKTRVKGKKKERKGEKSQAWAEDDFVWQLRIISSVAVDVKKDTEREDRHTNIKASWETATPGRAVKAKTSRDKFLHSLSLVPSSLDPEGKESGPKYVKTNTLPPAMVRIRREGAEEEVIDVEKLIDLARPPPPIIEPTPIIRSGSKSNMHRTRSHPSSSSSSSSSPSSNNLIRATSKNAIPNSSSVPCLPRSPSSSSTSNNNTNNETIAANTETTSSTTLTPPSSLFLPSIPSSSSSSPSSSLSNAPMPIANTTPSNSFTCNGNTKLNTNAKLRTYDDVARSHSKMAKENDEFVEWHNLAVEKNKHNLADADQSRETVLSYLEASRMEVKKKIMTFAERREQYNTKCFPQATLQSTPEKDQNNVPKEKTKRKKVSK